MHKKINLGLALSGGGARGLAHIGVLQALENANIPIDFLAGTSMGGVIGAAYASGLSPDEIAEIAEEFKNQRMLWRLADPTLPRLSIFQGHRLLTFFEEKLRAQSFDDLRIPLTLVAVDLNSGEEAYLNSGPLAQAVRSTVSIPGLLAPVEDDGKCLVDGGLLNNLPVDVVRNMGADVVVAVDVLASANDEPSYWQSLSEKRIMNHAAGGLIRILGDSLSLMMYHQNCRKLQDAPPDYLICPKIPPNVSVVAGYDQAHLLIEEGRLAALPILDHLKATLKD